MATKVAYWITTALIVLAYAAGGYFDIKQQAEEMLKDMESLGYPLYFLKMLGVWKLGAAVVLLAPALPLKEWAYAGILINLVAPVGDARGPSRSGQQHRHAAGDPGDRAHIVGPAPLRTSCRALGCKHDKCVNYGEIAVVAISAFWSRRYRSQNF